MKRLEELQKQQRYDLTTRKLLPKHREVLRLVMLGHADRTIALHLGLSPASVRNIRASDAGKRMLAIMQNSRDNSALDIQKRVQALAPDAMDVIEGAIKQDGTGADCLLTPKDRAKLALEVLDRAGHSPVKRTELHATGAVANYHLLTSLDQRAEEEEGGVVEAQWEEAS